jgi:membrane protease YdiL (CAAX protease family)
MVGDHTGARRASGADTEGVARTVGGWLAGIRGVEDPHLGTSSGNASAYGTVTKVTVGLLVFELAVRYPLTVFAEESFFRGYLQPRLPWAPPILSGVLWAGFHLQQPTPSPPLSHSGSPSAPFAGGRETCERQPLFITD